MKCSRCGRDNHQANFLAEAYLLAARVEEALATAERGLALARQCKEPVYEAQALELLGRMVASRESPALGEAETHYRQAIALTARCGARPLLARSHLGVGQLYRRAGQAASAREHLTTAATLLRELDMQLWLKEAEAALKELDARA